MAFTTPRTWTAGELVTKLIMDTHIRDNFNAIWVGTTAGDLDYYTSATAKARLAKPSVDSLLKNTSAGTPSWLPITSIPGLLHAKASVYYDAGAQVVTGTTYTNITNATVNITITTTCTIVMHCAGTLWSSDGTAYLKAVVGSAPEASGYHMNFDTVPTPIGWTYYVPNVPAGTYTCKLQGAADTAGHHGTYGLGNIAVFAYTE